jgi:hypothetical protein
MLDEFIEKLEKADGYINSKVPSLPEVFDSNFKAN